MTFTHPDVPELLRRHGLRPDKRLGQNFLIDQEALQKIVDAADIQAGDTVLEIGPGLGSLTCFLAMRAKNVIAVELDGHLIPVLQEVLASYDNVSLIRGDILKVNLETILPPENYLVVANIPYYITSAVIRYLLEASHTPHRLVLTVQREVAERICALPGDMSLLALSVQVYGQPQIVSHIPASAFYPAPQVDSAVVRVELYTAPIIEDADIDQFFLLAKAGFSQKRKTLRNALSGGMHWAPEKTQKILEDAGIQPNRRAETLSLDEWKVLTRLVGQMPIENKLSQD